MANNLIPIKLNVAMTDGKVEQRTVYVEKGVSFSLDGKSIYSVKSDGKLYTNNEGKAGISKGAVNVTAAQYGVLGGLSQQANEGGEENKKNYVLTSRDINAFNNEGQLYQAQYNINNTLVRLNTEESVSLNAAKGQSRDIQFYGDKVDVTLHGQNNKNAGSVSIFLNKQ